MNTVFKQTAIISFLALIIGGIAYMNIKHTPHQSAAPHIPMEDFFKNPEMSSFELSPNGQYIAFMKPWQRRMNVFVQRIGSNQETKLTNAAERGILGYAWLGNDRIAYAQDNGGDENTHLYAIDTDGSNNVDLTPFDGVKATIVDDLEDDPNFMLIGLNKENPQLFDVYRINVHTGNMDLVAKNPGNIQGWMTDNDGKLRIATTSDGLNTSLLYRATEDDEFKSLLTTDFKESVDPLYFTFDNKSLYVSSNRGRDKSAIYKFDLNTAKESDLIFEHDDVDVHALMRSKKRKVITGVSYLTDKRHTKFFDPERKAIQDKLEKQLPGVEIAITSLSKDENKAVVAAYSDKSRGTYYVYDTEKNELDKLAALSPWLREQDMAAMQPISYQARDGLTIHGYLTLPVGKEAKNLPVVVNPHGGPWVRDSWGFNPEVQYLANKGFAVLQMNYRGSTGYGRKFWEKSFKQWGKSMQDDITDGVHWLIGQGIADPKRVAIYGASYGGYATLAGLTFTPDLYACGVDYVGVSNLLTFMETLPPYWELGRQKLYDMVGDPNTEEALLRAASPVFHVDRIKAPLFVAQGANDPRVSKAESDQIVDALKKKGINVPYMVKDNEGHGFYNEENRFDFYREMGDFLDQCLNKPNT